MSWRGPTYTPGSPRSCANRRVRRGLLRREQVQEQECVLNDHPSPRGKSAGMSPNVRTGHAPTWWIGVTLFYSSPKSARTRWVNRFDPATNTSGRWSVDIIQPDPAR